VVFDTDVVRAARDGVESRAAGDVAHQEMVSVRPEVPLSEAVTIMAEHSLTHLVVVDAPLEPVGILSTFDVMRVLGGAR
jgi:CBS domain-containing protein